MHTEREGAVSRMMELLADASNIGAMGDLVDRRHHQRYGHAPPAGVLEIASSGSHEGQGH